MEFTIFEAQILAIAAIILGIYMLVKGGGWTIDAAVFVARNLGVSPLVVGFTIVAFGTSLPEMVISVLANLQGSPGIAIGNVLGSNIANILLVIGATALVGTIVASGKAQTRDLGMMMLATVILAYFIVTQNITMMAGYLMIGLLVAYVLFQYLMALNGDKEVQAKVEAEMEEADDFASMKVALFFLLAGLVCIALGAEFLVRGAKISATTLGVPEAVIALSIIAIGTSLPELSTCIIAARRGQTDIVLGNIVGSNVFNILMIMGVTAAVKPILPGSFAQQLSDLDIWLTVGVSVIFTLIILLYKKFTKPIGVIFLLAYAIYIVGIYAIYLQKAA